MKIDIRFGAGVPKCDDWEVNAHMADDPRPLSPHLQVYRPQVTSVLSIFHRLTGVVLAFAALLLTYWLASAAYGPDAAGNQGRAHQRRTDGRAPGASIPGTSQTSMVTTGSMPPTWGSCSVAGAPASRGLRLRAA